MNRLIKIIILTIVLVVSNQLYAQQGIYFSKKKYNPHRLPTFENTKDKLPEPVYEEDPLFELCYWKAWELAFNNFYEPTPGSGYVSQFADAAFNKQIFMWDTSFMIMFLMYGHPYVPSISSLDNFYAKQYPDGEIAREMVRTTGEQFSRWVNKDDKPLFSTKEGEVVYIGREVPSPNPIFTLDNLNHPIMAWAELESFRLTGDTSRLAMVWEPLDKYFKALDKYIRQGNGLYMTDWASMDNSPRTEHIKFGGCGVDISNEMVLFANCMARIAKIIDKKGEFKNYFKKSTKINEGVNRLMWNDQDKFYYDIKPDNSQVGIKTIAGFWPLIARVANTEQAAFMATHLMDKASFNRLHRVPTLAANEQGYYPLGGYWRGSSWAPTNTMVILGLEKYGFDKLAKEIAMNDLNCVIDIFKETGTVWENYAPDTVEPGKPAKPDFVGWSGMAPIRYFIEYAIGIKANAPENYIEWDITSKNDVGIRKLWFGGTQVDLMCYEADKKGKRQVEVYSDGDFTLKVKCNNENFDVKVLKNKKLSFNL